MRLSGGAHVEKDKPRIGLRGGLFSETALARVPNSAFRFCASPPQGPYIVGRYGPTTQNIGESASVFFEAAQKHRAHKVEYPNVDGKGNFF